MQVLSAKPRISLKNIVVATDFSTHSEVALAHAIVIARHYNSKIVLAHAFESVPHGRTAHELMGHTATERVADAERKLNAEAQKYPDVQCETRLLTGTALDVVEHLLALDHIDLIVVGTHGTKGLRKLQRGSVAEQIFHHVHCPVLVLGPSMQKHEPTWGPKRVLVATDLQSDESEALEYATALANEYNARLALLHFTIPTGFPFPQDSQLCIAPYFQSRLRELLVEWPELDHPADVWVEFGEDAVAGILQVASQKKIDLLILSVHPKQPWTSHFVHNAHRIASEAPCPVLVVQRKY